jgi:glycosyltransferase involved in cell wall biosynthesis
LKIAYFINEYPKVSHSFIRREIIALERQGFEVQRLALRGWSGSLPDEADRRERERTHYVLRGGVGGLILPAILALLRNPWRFAQALRLASRLARHSERSLAYHLVYVAEACLIARWLAESGARLLHAHFGTNSAEVAMLVRVLGGPPYSFTVHGPDEFMRPMGLGEKVHRASFVVAISFFGRSQLYLRTSAEDWPKIQVVRCGIEVGFHDVERVPISHAPRLVCVGRLCEAKAQILLIEAVAILRDAGVEIELVLAGDGPLRSLIEARIAEHQVEAQVRITGWLASSEVRREILEARALVLPSYAEGLPVVLMEAMALRRPVLTTYVAGIPELVKDGKNGWLFPAGSVEDLARAMRECIESPVERLDELGNQGYHDVLAAHSIDRAAAELGQLFRAIGDGSVSNRISDS